MHRRAWLIFLSLIVGIVVGLAINPTYALAQFLQWDRQDVVPVIFVQPSTAGFIPQGGNALGPTWNKDKVVPLILVRSNNLGGFIPANGGYGSMIGNTWQKDDVRPFIIVKPGPVGGFIPAN